MKPELWQSKYICHSFFIVSNLRTISYDEPVFSLAEVAFADYRIFFHIFSVFLFGNSELSCWGG